MISAYSTDAGKTWQRGGNPGKHAEDINEAYIDLAADTKGHFHVAWLSDPLENGYQASITVTRVIMANPGLSLSC